MNAKRLIRSATLTLACALPFAYAQAETTHCTEIASLPYVISTAGVYCLTGDLASSAASGNAIDVLASNVVIDLNGHKLDGSAAGAGTWANAIHALDRRSITVKNGTIRGFHYAVSIIDSNINYTNSSSHVIEGIRAEANTSTGFYIVGAGNIVRNNLVADTKGPSSTFGIMVAGPGSRVLNNDVIGTSAGITASYGIYLLYGNSAVVEGNRVSNTLCPNCQSTGIYGSPMNDASIIGNRISNTSVTTSSIGIKMASGARMIVSDNRVTGFEGGINMASPASGMYMNNLVVGATTAYSGGSAAGATNFSY